MGAFMNRISANPSVRRNSLPIATQITFWVWFGASFGYGLYAWLSYSGPFRWLADFEIDHFGSYQERPTAIAVGLMTLGLSAPLFFLVDRVIRRPRGLQPASMTEASIGKGSMTKSPIRAILVLSLGSIVVAAGAGVLGYRKLQEPVTFEPFNLAEGIQPRSSHVELTGMAVPSMQILFTERYTTTTYMPLVPTQWHEGDPVIYFLRRDGDRLGSDRHSFQIRQEGVLIRNDLPGAVASRYEKRGVKVGTPPMVLDAAEHDDLIPYWITAALGGCFGLSLLFAVLLIHIRERWRAYRIVPS
jgi:hypothetical protein